MPCQMPLGSAEATLRAGFRLIPETGASIEIYRAESNGRRNTWTKGLRWALGSGARIGPGEIFCLRRVGQGWRGVRIGDGSGRRSRQAWRVRRLRAGRVYRRDRGTVVSGGGRHATSGACALVETALWAVSVVRGAG